MRSHATKLIEITEKHADEIARQWYNNVKMNPKTPAYHAIPAEKAVRHALSFYGSFRNLFFSDNPFEEAAALFSKYAEERYKEAMPLPQVIYAMILMRRHMWLFSESQATFVTAVEMQLAAENLSRTILMFDYAMYVVITKYDELLRKEIDAKFKSLKIKNPFEMWAYVPEQTGGTQRKTV